MAMQYDVLASKPLIATGQVLAQNNGTLRRIRIKTIYGLSGAAAGSVVLRDGGATGTVLMTINTPAQADSGTYWLPLPGEGILVETDLHATLTGVGTFMVIYG